MPPSFPTVMFAAEVLQRVSARKTPRPHIVPLASGGVQIEWFLPEVEIEVAIEGPAQVTAIRETMETGEIDETRVDSDLTALVDWLRAAGA